MNAFLQPATLATIAAWLLAAKLAAAILVFDPGSFSAFSQPKVLAGNVFSVALLGFLAALGLAERRAVLARSPLHVPVAGLAAWYVVSAAFSLDRDIAIYGADGRYLGLLVVLDGLLIYIAIAALWHRPKTPPVVAGAVAVACAAVLAYAIVQRLGLDPVSWANPGIERPVSTIGNADPLGHVTAVVATAGIAFGLAPGVPLRVRRAAAMVVVVAGAGWFLSGTRAPVLGVGLGLMSVGAAWVLNASGAARASRGAAAVAGMLLLAVAVALSPIGGRLADTARSLPALLRGDLPGIEAPLAGRLAHYYVGSEEVWSRPVTGVGPDNYVVAFLDHRVPGTDELYGSSEAQTSVHSSLWKVATDAGLPGLILYVSLVAYGVAIAVRRRGDPWMLAGGVMLLASVATGSISISHVSTEWIVWASLGVIAARSATSAETPAAAPRPGKTRGRRASRRRGPAGRPPLGARLALGAGAVALFVVGASTWNTWTAAHAAVEAAARLRALDAGALIAAARATELDPRQARYWTYLGRAHQLAGEHRDAARAFARAAELAPYEIGSRVELIRVELAVGRGGDDAARARALEHADRAVAIDESRPDVRAARALVYYEQVRYAEAAEEVDLALGLAGERPLPGFAYEVGASAYTQLGRADEAQAWALRGIPLVDEQVRRNLRITLAMAFIAKGDAASAMREIDAVLAIYPQDEEARQMKERIERP